MLLPALEAGSKQRSCNKEHPTLREDDNQLSHLADTPHACRFRLPQGCWSEVVCGYGLRQFLPHPFLERTMSRPKALLGSILTIAIASRIDAQSSSQSLALPVEARRASAVEVTEMAQSTAARRRASRSAFTRNDLLLLGTFVLGTTAAARFDEPWDRRLQTPSIQRSEVLGASARRARTFGSPGSIVLTSALYAGGRLLNQRPVADAGLHATEAVLLSGAVTTLLKGLTGRARPNVPNSDPGEQASDADDFQLGRGFGGSYTSFPSGHTTVAFAAASALTRELSGTHPRVAWFVGPLLYGGATAVGLSRMYENKHWASDVIAGAAVGTLIGRSLVAYQHARRGNSLDRLLLPNVAAPSAGGFAVGWSLSLR